MVCLTVVVLFQVVAKILLRGCYGAARVFLRWCYNILGDR